MDVAPEILNWMWNETGPFDLSQIAPEYMMLDHLQAIKWLMAKRLELQLH
jgi:hypothetical protein